VEPTPDGLRLILPRTDSFWSKQRLTALGSGALFCAFIALYFILHSLRGPGAIVVYTLSFGVMFCVWIIVWVIYAPRPAMVTVTAKHIHLDVFGIVRTIRRTWPRGQIRAITVWQGLRIATGSKNEEVLAGRDGKELEWIAAVLQRILQVSGDLSARWNDVRVTFTGTFWDEPVLGILHVEPGEMTLGRSLATTPHLKFRATEDTFLNWWSSDAVMLSNSDVICRKQENGVVCLQIDPANVSCGFRSGHVPYLNFGPLSLTKLLPRDMTDKERISWSESSLRLTLWCDDPEALPKALSLFWGDRDQSAS
jgi:hypothetical protein